MHRQSSSTRDVSGDKCGLPGGQLACKCLLACVLIKCVCTAAEMQQAPRPAVPEDKFPEAVCVRGCMLDWCGLVEHLHDDSLSCLQPGP